MCLEGTHAEDAKREALECLCQLQQLQGPGDPGDSGEWRCARASRRAPSFGKPCGARSAPLWLAGSMSRMCLVLASCFLVPGRDTYLSCSGATKQVPCCRRGQGFRTKSAPHTQVLQDAFNALTGTKLEKLLPPPAEVSWPDTLEAHLEVLSLQTHNFVKKSSCPRRRPCRVESSTPQ